MLQINGRAVLGGHHHFLKGGEGQKIWERGERNQIMDALIGGVIKINLSILCQKQQYITINEIFCVNCWCYIFYALYLSEINKVFILSQPFNQRFTIFVSLSIFPGPISNNYVNRRS